MKKRGFTLIELLAVIVILGVIALITVSSVSGVLKSYKNKLYQNQIDNIESAARVWASDNMLLLPNGSENTCEYENINNCSDNYNKLIIKLDVLQDGGYLDKDLKNVKTKENFENVEIIITKNNKKMEYEVIDQTYFKYEVGDKIVVQVNDLETVDFYVIEESTERTKYVKALVVEPLSNDNIAWCSNCTTNSNGSTTINENLNLLGWNNTIEKRLITAEEFNDAKEIIKNDSDKSWLGGDYWTSTSYGTTYAYYINSNNELVSDSIVNGHKIRPVIKISKTYVKLK